MSSLPPQPARSPRIKSDSNLEDMSLAGYKERNEGFLTLSSPTLTMERDAQVNIDKGTQSSIPTPPEHKPTAPKYQAPVNPVSPVSPTKEVQHKPVMTPERITTPIREQSSYADYTVDVEQGKTDSLISSVLGLSGLVTLLTGIFGVWFFFVPFVLSTMALIWAKKASVNKEKAVWGRVLGWIGIGTALAGVIVVALITGIIAAIVSAFS